MRPYIPLILAVLLGCLAVFAGSYAFKEQGYVLFSYGKYYVEATLITVMTMLVLLWFVERVLIWLFKKVWGLGSATKMHFFAKGEHKAQLALHQGLTAFLLKDWQRAEKLISESGKRSGLLQTKPLFGAIAADAMGDEDKVLAYLATLETSDNDSVILKAELLTRQGEADQAFELIKPLYDKQGKDDVIMHLYVRILREREGWAELLTLLAKIEKRKLYDDNNYLKFAAMVIENALKQTAKSQSVEAVEQQWKQLPGKLKQHSLAISAYVAVLAANGQQEQAQTLLLKTLKKGQVEDYLPLFRTVRLSQPLPVNQYLQSKLKDDEDNPHLLCALGHLAAGSGDYSLAGKALGKAAPSSIADLNVLANAYSQTGQHANAVAVYQKLNKQ
jgi:heme biosynthesis-associated TPR repeat protein